MKKVIGTIGLLLVAMIWGSGFVVSDIALETYHPLQINALRFLIAGILSILFFLEKAAAFKLENDSKRMRFRDRAVCGFFIADTRPG